MTSDVSRSPGRLLPRRVRAGVWAAFVLLVTVGGVLLRSGDTAAVATTPSSAVVVSASAGTAGGRSASSPAGTSVTSVGTAAIPVTVGDPSRILADPRAPTTSCAYVTANGKKMCGEADTLPAWRWSNTTVAMDSDSSGGAFGISGAIRVIINSVATFLFLVAALVWSLLLIVLRFGFGTEFVNLSAVAINKGMTSIGTFIYALVVLFGLWTIKKVWKPFTRGDLLTVWKAFLRLLIGFGLVFGMVTFAQKADNEVGADSGKLVAYKGTVPWLAKTVSDASAELPAKATQLARLSEWGSSVTAEKGSAAKVEGEGPGPTCAAYIGALHDIYSTGKGTTAFGAISQFWEQTFYKSWTYAAYGMPTTYKSAVLNKNYSTDLASRSMCRWAEMVSNQPAADQIMVAKLAWSSYDAKNGGAANPFANAKSNVFVGQGTDDDPDFDVRRAMTAWNACYYENGKWRTHDPWRMVWIGAAAPSTVQAGGGGDHFEDQQNQCTKAFTNGILMVDGSSADSFDVYTEGQAWKYTGTDDNARQAVNAHLQAAKSWRDSSRGNSIGTRMIFGLMSILVALMSFYIFGFMAVGLLFSQLMLIGLLVLLPVTIAMVTLDAGPGEKLLKLTGTTMISKSLFTLIITVMVAMTQVVQTIAGNLITAQGFGSGFMSAVLVSLAPIGAAMTVRMLLQKMQLGDIMKPTGAISFATAAAAKSANKNSPGFGNLAGKSFGEKGVLKKAGGKMDKGASMDKLAKQGALFSGRVARSTRSKGREKNRTRRQDRRFDRHDKRMAKQQAAADAVKRRADKVKELEDWAKGQGLTLDDVGRTKLGERYRRFSGLSTPPAAPGTPAPAPVAYDPATGLPIDPSARGPVAPEPVNADRIATRREIDEAADAQRKFTRQVASDPVKAAQARVERVEDLVDGVNEARFGAEFEGFSTDTEKAAYIYGFARTNNVAVGDVIAGDNGLMMNTPMSLADAKVNLDLDDLQRQWQHFLPDDVKVRLASETDTEYVTRLHVEGLERGLLTPDGRPISVLAKVGLDLDNAEHRAAVEQWKNGVTTKLTEALDSIRFDSPDSAGTARMVMVAQAQAQQAMKDATARRDAADAELAAAIDEFSAVIPDHLARAQNVSAQTLDHAHQYRAALDDMARMARTGADNAALAAADQAVSAARAVLDADQSALLAAVWETRNSMIDVGVSVDPGTGSERAQHLDEQIERTKAQIENLRAMFDAVRLGQADAVTQLNEHLDREIDEYFRAQVQVNELAARREEDLTRARAASAARDARTGSTTRRPLTARDVRADAEPFPV